MSRIDSFLVALAEPAARALCPGAHGSRTCLSKRTLLPPSEYRVKVNMAGFKTETRGVTLQMEQIGRLDFALQVGSQAETIEVQASALMLESSNASVGQVIDSQPIQDLPLNGRNYL